MAAFGWGAAWLTPERSIAHHVSTAAFRDDPAQFALADIRTTALMVHLRRPSKLSTIGLPDAQPFIDPDGRFAFSHNGDLAGFKTIRPLPGAGAHRWEGGFRRSASGGSRIAGRSMSWSLAWPSGDDPGSPIRVGRSRRSMASWVARRT